MAAVTKVKNNFKVILFIVAGFITLFAILGGGAYMIYRFAASKVAEQKVSQQILDSETQVNSLLESGKYVDAMTVAKKMLASSKNNNEKAISDQMMGYVYLAQKDCPNAQTSFTESAGLNSNLPLDFLGEGNCDLLSKNYQKTIDDTQKGLTLLDSIQKLPDSVKSLDGLTTTSISQLQAVSHALMGTAYLGLGNKTQSVQELEEAVKLDPGNPQYTKDLNEVQNAIKPAGSPKPNI
jgi:tetratricopeptide (TPR) repeat protein